MVIRSFIPAIMDPIAIGGSSVHAEIDSHRCFKFFLLTANSYCAAFSCYR